MAPYGIRAPVLDPFRARSHSDSHVSMFQTDRKISKNLAEMAEILSTVFEQLDYLDDGFVDG